MEPATLSVAIVTYRTDPGLLECCLRTLAESVEHARGEALLSDVDVYLIDNGSSNPPSPPPRMPAHSGLLHTRSGHGNLGYGRANNLVLADLSSDFHIVMNPDVELDVDAISAMLRTFRERAEVGLVAPAVKGSDGERQYLCKRYPTLWVLFLRGFAPRFVRHRFAAALDRYEMRDAISDEYVDRIPLASGCFMAMRTQLFRELGGFDPSYFMYFEDYDLSLRLGRKANIAYAPAVRIVHRGGDATAKGARHVLWFIGSARRFFSRHGWKIA
jgi:GT2 family glycosyltransferase